MDGKVKEAKVISDLRDDLQKEAEKQIFHVFPKKIADLGKALQSDMFDTRNISAIHCDLMVPLPSPVINGSDPLASGDGLKSVPKKRKFEEEDEEFLCIRERGGISLMLSTVAPKRPAYFSGMVPGNVKLEAIIDFIKPEILTVIDSCNTLKIWIQLLIPRIEDGNNFGVSIQEEVLGEVGKAESDAGTYLDQISRYFNVRAKMVSKVAKYPQLADYRRSVNEYDEKVFFSFKLIVTELRNMYAVLYDMIMKNYEKLNKPRTSNTHAMY